MADYKITIPGNGTSNLVVASWESECVTDFNWNINQPGGSPMIPDPEHSVRIVETGTTSGLTFSTILPNGSFYPREATMSLTYDANGIPCNHEITLFQEGNNHFLLDITGLPAGCSAPPFDVKNSNGESLFSLPTGVGNVSGMDGKWSTEVTSTIASKIEFYGNSCNLQKVTVIFGITTVLNNCPLDSAHTLATITEKDVSELIGSTRIKFEFS